jgi:RHS repeat-associated protein
MLLCLLCSAPSNLWAQTEQIEYYGLDAIGSVRVVFDATGNVKGRMDYAPFGEELFSGLFVPSERFAQLNRDAEAGVDYAQARMYQPRTGRFNSPDSVYTALFQPQEWNRYSYSLNSPLVNVDPEGKCIGCRVPNMREYFPAFETATNVSASPPTSLINSPGAIGQLLSEGIDELRSRVARRLDRLRKAVKDTADEVKEKVCDELPDGRVAGVSGGIGGLGATVVGAEVVVNYNTGEISGFVYSEVQGGWNGVLSGSAYIGFTHGLGWSNANYTGGFMTASGTVGLPGSPVGIGGFKAVSAPIGSFQPSPGGTIARGGMAGASMRGAVTLGVSKTHYVQRNSVSIRSAAGQAVATPVDNLMYSLRQACR